MLDILKQKIENTPNYEDKINKIREFLQIIMLKILFDQGNFDNLAFVGGTALRILYDLKRYSEDLDFSLIQPKGYDFKKLLEKLIFNLEKYNLNVEYTIKMEKVVHNSFLKFPKLLQQLDLKVLKNQKLSVKLEIDTNPPKGWHTELKPITETFIFALNTFDLPSLYATKLHACFFRKFKKGRDFYDLLWYLGKRIEPNYILLNNAIKQTENKNMKIDTKTLKPFIQDQIKKMDFRLIQRDVERFLENKNEVKLLDAKFILKLL